jgi:hypothetical protein
VLNREGADLSIVADIEQGVLLQIARLDQPRRHGGI